MIPVEIDFNHMHRQRQYGLRGLDQPLKSFRDCTVEFPIYHCDHQDCRYLDSLGPLEKPQRGAHQEASVKVPQTVTSLQ